jgi:metal-sulfur cluster biosynthetic enzyme
MMTTLTEDSVIKKLQDVIDPEVGLNIVDMGLVYSITITEGHVEIFMTLTTRGCPMSSYLTQKVETAAGSLEGVLDVKVNLVWSPQWSSDRIKPEALESLRAGRKY